MTDLVVGVDSSTQATKIELRAIDSGDLVATARAPHPPATPPTSEQDPRAWWGALTVCLGRVREHLAEVRAISIAAQQHGLVVLDASGEVIRPAKLWNDTTSSPQAAWLVDCLGPAAWAEASGLVPVASITISKLAWLAEHEPERFARVTRVMLPHDYITWRLTGAHVTDRGDVSGTGWWDPRTGEYRRDLLGLFVDDSDAWIRRLPRVLGPNEAAGVIAPEVATALGLPPDVVVGPGTGDNMAAAIGLALATGDLAMSLGTSGTVFAVSDRPTHDPSGAVAGFADANGQFLPLVCTINATGVTDAVARWLGVDRDELAVLALDEPPDEQLVLVPYLGGERTPNLPDASGTISGLRTGTTRAQIASSAHLGVLCGLLDGVDALVASGMVPSGRLLLVGGGARSAAYRQLLADLWGRAITVPTTQETVAAGAAAQAAAVLVGQEPNQIARRWGFGGGVLMPPTDSINRYAIREAYHRATKITYRSQ